jgi:hypothetical protein
MIIAAGTTRSTDIKLVVFLPEPADRSRIH